MAKRNSYDKDSVVADWKSGNYTIRELARRYKVSSTTIHNVVKGTEKTLEPLINKQCEINQELAILSEQELNTFRTEVDERTKHIQFFNNATVKNLSSLVGKICDKTTINEHRLAQMAIKDGRETVLGKDPTTAVQVNNTTNNADESNTIVFKGVRAVD